MNSQRNDETPGGDGVAAAATARVGHEEPVDDPIADDAARMMIGLAKRLRGIADKGAASSGVSRDVLKLIDALLSRIVEHDGRGAVTLGTEQVRAAVRTELAGRASRRAVADSDLVAKPGPGTIQVHVKSLIGRTTTVRARWDDTVYTLKRRIRDVDGIPEDQQRLVFAGAQLDDDRTLHDCRVWDGATVHQILRLRGGMFHPSSGRSGMHPSIETEVRLAVRADAPCARLSVHGGITVTRLLDLVAFALPQVIHKLRDDELRALPDARLTLCGVPLVCRDPDATTLADLGVDPRAAPLEFGLMPPPASTSGRPL